MKRLFITLCCVAAITACERPKGEYAKFADTPGIELGEGQSEYNEYTRYMDALISQYGDMVYLLELISEQKGDIDDDLLLERFNDSYVYASDGYLTSETYDCTDEEWTWAYDWIGGPVLGSIALNNDGTYYTRGYVSYCEPHPFETYLYERGIVGYYAKNNSWSYDPETNTLTTHNEGWNLDLTAEVLYFDGEKAVMLGQIDGIASLGYNRYNNHEGGICHRLELYLIEFPEREQFFENRVSKEEFDALYEEYLAAGGEEIYH